MPAGDRYTPYGMVATVELSCTRCGDLVKKIADPADLQHLISYANDPDHEDVVWVPQDPETSSYR
jgi:hypothetical protein